MNITFKNKISFNRLKSSNVTGYNIYSIEGDNEVLIHTIQNTLLPNPVYKREKLEYNSDLIFYIPEDIYCDSDHPVKLYINNEIVSIIRYSYFHDFKRLKILDKNIVSMNDIIEVEYCLDQLEYEYNTTKNAKYIIKPIYTASNLVGDHNILR